VLAGSLPGPEGCPVNTAVFIMANGRATRLPGKHLKPIRGEPLISRTLRQLKGHDVRVYVVAHNPRILALSDTCVINPGPNQQLAESILQTEISWTDRNIVLMGDVVFSDDAIQKIITINQLAVVGSVRQDRIKRGAERYALVFLKKDIPLIKKALKGFITDKLIQDTDLHSGLKHISCSMTNPYLYPLLYHTILFCHETHLFGRDIQGFMKHHILFKMPWKRYFVELDEPMVDDIDTQDQYEAVLRRWEAV
jgi:hypothetical protein